MKIKRTTYGEIRKRFGGLKRLAVEREERNLSTSGFMPLTYRAVLMYRKQKDCTYVAISCLGWINLFGPKEDDLMYAMKFDGKITAEDLTDEEFKYHDEFISITEELYNKWHDKLQEHKEES